MPNEKQPTQRKAEYETPQGTVEIAIPRPPEAPEPTDPYNRERSRIGELEYQLRRQSAKLKELEKLVGQMDTAPIRAQVLRELTKLLPIALQRARSPKGSPALLRLILRSLRSL